MHGWGERVWQNKCYAVILLKFCAWSYFCCPNIDDTLAFCVEVNYSLLKNI